MKIDVRGLKKIASDGKSSTFLTAKGHRFIVAHKALDKTNLKQLNALPMAYQEQSDKTDFSNVNNMPKNAPQMAEGGGVGGQNHAMFHGVKNKIYNWSGHQQDAQLLPQEVKGNPIEMDMPGRTEEPQYQQISSPVQSEDITMAKGGMVPHYAQGTPDEAVGDQNEALKRLNLSKHKSDINSAPLPASQASPNAQGAIGPNSPLAVSVTPQEAGDLTTAGNPLPASAGYSLPGGMEDLAQGYQTQLGGLQKEQQGASAAATAQGALGSEQAGTLAGGINQLNTMNNAFTQHYMNLTNERQSLMQEMSSGAQHLDPQRFIKNMSTGGKIMTGIGLVLGGIGSGMTHGPNLAADFLQRNIDRDIENQRLQMGVKQNLLNFNFQQSRDLQDAANFTKLNTMDMVGMHLKQQAALAQNPLQQAALLNQAGIIDQKAGELQNQIAMRRAFMQIGSGGGGNSEQAFQQQNNFLRMMPGEEGTKLAKDRESKHVAGVGQASREVPQNVLAEITSRQDFDNAIRDLQTFGAQHSGSVVPAIIRQGEAKAKIVQDKARQANAQGVFKKSEADFMNSIINDNPTQMFEKYRAGKGYEEARKSNISFLNSLKKTYGLPITQEQQQAQESPQEVERLTKDKRIAIFDGKTKKFLRYK